MSSKWRQYNKNRKVRVMMNIGEAKARQGGYWMAANIPSKNCAGEKPGKIKARFSCSGK